jgi:hypothetical protein
MKTDTTRRQFIKTVGLSAAALTGAGKGLAQAAADPTANTIREEPRDIPVACKCDICVIGAGSAGTFAAVRAARLGATVALIENNGFFGGVATAGMVNVWHSLYDTEGKIKIIGGLTDEVVSKLAARGAANIYAKDLGRGCDFNTSEMILALDELVAACDNLRPFLHCKFTTAIGDSGKMTHAIIEDKSGRRAIEAKFFIDASGDGDVIARLGLPYRKLDDLQPPTLCAVLSGLDHLKKRNKDFDYRKAIFDPKYKHALKPGFIWDSPIPNVPGALMVYATRVNAADCSDADQLTKAEMEGRRQARAIRDILHDNFDGGEAVQITDLAPYIGTRETRHIDCLHTLTEKEVLEGVRFDDAVANGSYRVDVHHSDKPGLTFRYLDGTEQYLVPGRPAVAGRWRPQRDSNPTFYQIPYRSLVPKGSKNVLVTGRLLDADRGAFGAVRVMVNGNQTAEAVAAACWLALKNGWDVTQVDVKKLRQTLSENGAIVL